MKSLKKASYQKNSKNSKFIRQTAYHLQQIQKNQMIINSYPLQLNKF
jgi:hypothetical protein